MEEEKEYKIYHKIEPGKKYRVWKTINQRGQIFYKIQVIQKEWDGTNTKHYVSVTFKKGVELDDPKNQGTDIIIHEAYENFRVNPLDKYNGIMYLMITDFEICERQEQIEAQAFDEFRENLDEIEIDDNFLD